VVFAVVWLRAGGGLLVVPVDRWRIEEEEQEELACSSWRETAGEAALK